MHRMIPMKQEATSSALGSTSNNNNNNPKPSRATSSTWSRLKDPRIVCMSRAFGGKDRHSKVCTVRGIRDRRIRLSVPTAIQLYDLQDRLGLNQPSKVVDWLLNAARHGIDELPPLEIPEGCFARMINSLGKENPKIVPDNDWQNPKSNQMAEGLYLSREKPCFQIPDLDSSSISRENAYFHVVPGLENSVTGDIEKACFQNPGLEKYSATREKACFQDPGMYNFDPSNLTLSQIVIPGNPGITGQPDQELQYNLGSLLQLPASIIPSGLSTSHHNQTNCFLPYEMPGTNTEFVPKLSNFPASMVSNSSSLPSLVHYRETLSAVRTAPFSTAEHFSDVKNVLVEQNRINEFHA